MPTHLHNHPDRIGVGRIRRILLISTKPNNPYTNLIMLNVSSVGHGPVVGVMWIGWKMRGGGLSAVVSIVRSVVKLTPTARENCEYPHTSTLGIST